MKVEIYTDGSSRGNPGRGGYGVILKMGPHEKELSQGYKVTTNNRMELLATIVGLEALTRDGIDVTIYSDSKYVVESVEKKWVFGWEKKGYKDKKNPDLWQRFLRIYRKHNVRFIWIRGHNDHPFNERCDVSLLPQPTTVPGWKMWVIWLPSSSFSFRLSVLGLTDFTLLLYHKIKEQIWLPSRICE